MARTSGGAKVPSPQDGDAAVGDDPTSSQTDAPFAPAEPTDGRDIGKWRTRYDDPIARRQIRNEGLYLVAVIVISMSALLSIALEWPRPQVGLTSVRWESLAPYADSWLGGAVGGALFSGKWLIHTVGRGSWNQDRLPWRIFTPWLGAGAGFVVVLLSASRVLPLFDADFVRTGAGATGISLLVGFFADRTFSRLEGFAAAHLQPSSKDRTKK
jgi:hypothetical protein